MKFSLGLLFGVAAAVCTTALVHAQEYPARVIRMVVPFPPGASTDVVTRLVAEELGKDLGQSVVVENRGGAAGLVGMAYLARSAPDGYTLAIGNEGTHVTTAVMKKQMPYDSLKDFTPITLASRSTMAFAVNTTLVPVGTIAELIEYTKKNPKKVSFGTAGIGAPQHLAGELFKQRTGAIMEHAPYSGAGPATNDLLGGHLPMLIGTMPSLVPHFGNPQIRILAIGDARRRPELPGTPTLSETVPGMLVAGWNGFFAPAGLPQPIQARLNQGLVKAIKSPRVDKALRDQFLVPVASSPQELADVIKEGIERWTKVVEAARIERE
jgi:tripartite-type tricarboxylate transporter receptor subunit TctC